MKWHVAVWLVLGLLFPLPVGAAQEAEKPVENAEKPAEVEQKPSDAPPAEPLAPPFGHAEPDTKPTSQALGLIYVQPGTGRSGGSLEPLYALLRSHEVHDAAIASVAKKQLGSVPDDLKQVDISITGGTKTTHVVSYDERLPAGLVLGALKDEAARRLIELDKPESLSHRRDQEQRQVEQLLANWTRERQALIAIAKQYGVEVDTQVAAQRRLSLATETQSLQVQQRGLEARHAVLEKQLAELAAKAKDEASEAILKELAGVVEARKRYVEHLREAQVRPGKAGAESAAEKLEPAKAELAQAEVELARFRREAAASHNQRAVELRHRLEDTIIEKAENEVKLAELQRLNTTSVQVDVKRIEVELLEQKYRRAKQELDELDAELFRYNLTPPQVVLIRTK